LLTGDYLEGRRKSYAPPLRSYLVLSLVYFLIASVVTTTGTRVVGPTGQAIETKNCAQVAAEATWAAPPGPGRQKHRASARSRTTGTPSATPCKACCRR